MFGKNSPLVFLLVMFPEEVANQLLRAIPAIRYNFRGLDSGFCFLNPYFSLEKLEDMGILQDMSGWQQSVGAEQLTPFQWTLSLLQLFSLWFTFTDPFYSLISPSCLLSACICARSVSSVVSNSVAPWTVADQAPLSMGFSRQEYWSGLPCPPSGDLPNPGIEPYTSNVSCIGKWFFTISTT